MFSDKDSISHVARRGLLLVIVLSAAWRLVRYLLRMPLWGDEAMLALNFLDRDAIGLLAPLANGQVSPVLFLWLEKAVLESLGSSELALRLLPVAAGFGGLWLFHRLARSVLEPLPAVLATATLAVSYYIVRHSVEVKPYSFDLLAALALYLPAAAFVQRKDTKALMLWSAAAPIAMLVSYPAVFAFGACAAALLLQMRHASWKERGIWLAGCALGATAFLWMLAVVASRQYTELREPMTLYWKDSFPPAGLSKLPLWLLQIHAGNMMAYPVGGRNLGSLGTLVLAIIGMWISAKKWPRSLLVLFVLPFVLTLLAAFMHRYPYGGSARIAQHLAPAICLWFGVGVAWLIERASDANRRRAATVFTLGVLGVIAIGGIIRDIRHPAKTPGDARARDRVHEWLTPKEQAGTFIVWEPMNDVPPNFQWYLRTSGRNIVWNARAMETWPHEPDVVNVVGFDRNGSLPQSAASRLPGFQMTGHVTEEILVGPPELGPVRWESVRFERQP
ncbi:MAG: glycosyltransferase family 39 protein [Verrucomicrobiaceae bacterium]